MQFYFPTISTRISSVGFRGNHWSWMLNRNSQNQDWNQVCRNKGNPVALKSSLKLWRSACLSTFVKQRISAQVSAQRKFPPKQNFSLAETHTKILCFSRAERYADFRSFNGPFSPIGFTLFQQSWFLAWFSPFLFEVQAQWFPPNLTTLICIEIFGKWICVSVQTEILFYLVWYAQSDHRTT